MDDADLAELGVRVEGGDEAASRRLLEVSRDNVGRAVRRAFAAAGPRPEARPWR